MRNKLALMNMSRFRQAEKSFSLVEQQKYNAFHNAPIFLFSTIILFDNNLPKGGTRSWSLVHEAVSGEAAPRKDFPLIDT